MTEISDRRRTVWFYGVPMEKRAVVVAAFPDVEANFISIRVPTSTYGARVLGSYAPSFAVWGGQAPDDLRAFSSANGLAVGTLSERTVWSLAPAAVTPRLLTLTEGDSFFDRTDALGRGNLLSADAVDDREKDFLDKYLEAIASVAGERGAGAVLGQFLRNAGTRKTVLAVAETPFLSWDETISADRVLQFAASIRQQYPDAAIVLMVPEGLVDVVAERALKDASIVVAHQPVAALLASVDVVATNGGAMGFEIALTGQAMFAPADVAFAPVDRDFDVDEWNLSEPQRAGFLARLMLTHSRWLEPETNDVVDPVQLSLGPDWQAAFSGAGASQTRATLPPVNIRQVQKRNEITEEMNKGKLTAADIAARYARQAEFPRALRIRSDDVGGADAASPPVYFMAATSAEFEVAAQFRSAMPSLTFEPLLADVNAATGLENDARRYAEAYPDILLREFSADIVKVKLDCASVVFFEITSAASRIMHRALEGAGIKCVLIDLYDQLSLASELTWGFDAVVARSNVTQVLDAKGVANVGLSTDDLNRMMSSDLALGRARMIDLMSLRHGVLTYGILLGPDLNRKDRVAHAISVLVKMVEELDGPDAQAIVSVSRGLFAKVPSALANTLVAMQNLYLDFDGALLGGAFALAACADVTVTDSDAVASILAATGFVGVHVEADPMPMDMARTKFASFSSGMELPLVLHIAKETASNGTDAAGDRPSSSIETLMADIAALLTAPPRAAPASDAWMSTLTPFERNLVRGSALDILCVGLDSGEAAAGGSQKYLLPLLGAKSRAHAVAPLSSVDAFVDVDVFAHWGMKPIKAKQNLRAIARQLNAPVLILEDGFIRSVAIGLSGEPALAVLMDTRTAYFNATQPSLMETILNSDMEIAAEDLAEARRMIDMICANRISKYNHAPDRLPALGRPGKSKILLVDQRYGDMSIALGMAREEDFPAMLWALIGQQGDFDILIKRHPDAMSGLKGSCFGDDVIAPARHMSQVTLIDFEVNPFALIDSVDQVHVVTSGFGFEALMAGKEVHCHGQPFYSGWGLTVDHQVHRRRRRTRTLEEIFYVSYMMLSRYYSPALGRRCSLEEVITYIQAEKLRRGLD